MSSQHFHDKALFLLDFRNSALERSVLRVEGFSAGLQAAAVTFPSRGARGEVAPPGMREIRAHRGIRAVCAPGNVSISGLSCGTSPTSKSH